MVDIFNTTTMFQFFEQNVYFQWISSLIGRTYVELFFFTLGLFVYAFFVWQFYKRLAKRDLFTVDLEKYEMLPDSTITRLKKFGSGLLYILKYLILFPLYVAFWFAVLSLFLFILAKDVPVRQVIFMSIILISSIRMMSYYKEELASDFAKLLPFVFLGILLTEPTFFTFTHFYARIEQLPTLTSDVFEFFIFTIVFEWIIRLVYSSKKLVIGNNYEEVEDEEEEE